MAEYMDTPVPRRTVAKGIAWSVPAVAVASAAPMAAASPICLPNIYLDQALSCKCPGNSSPQNPKNYYLTICASDPECLPEDSDNFITITAVQNGSGAYFTFWNGSEYVSNFSIQVPLGGCVDGFVQFQAPSSAQWVVVTYMLNGEQHKTLPHAITAPPDCDQNAEGECLAPTA